MPIKNYRISQEYGRKNAIYRKGYHTGIDLVAIGDPVIRNAGIGKVIRARFSIGIKGADPNGWGNYIIVRQDDGHDVLYAHLASVAVEEGAKVKQDDKLGIQGSTGKSTGPHLHFEVWDGSWENRNDTNPADYLGIKNTVGAVKKIKPAQDEPSAWAKNAWAWAVKEGLFDGTNPQGPVTREQLAAVLERVLKKK